MFRRLEILSFTAAFATTLGGVAFGAVRLRSRAS